MSFSHAVLRAAGARSLQRLHGLRPGDSAAQVLALLGPPDRVLPGEAPGQWLWQHTLYDQQQGWIAWVLVLDSACGPLLHWALDAPRQRAFDDLLAGLTRDDAALSAPPPPPGPVQ